MGPFGKVKYLVENGADLNATVGVYDGTALMYTCIFGFFKVVKHLVKHGADVNAKNNKRAKEIYKKNMCI